MDDPIILFQQESRVLKTRLRPAYIRYPQVGLDWEILSLAEGQFSRQLQPVAGAHFQIIEANIHQPVTIPYAIRKPTCFLFILFRGGVEFVHQLLPVTQVLEPCIYFRYDPAGRYSIKMDPGLHSFILVAFEQHWAFTNPEQYPLFVPLVENWQGSNPEPFLLPSVAITPAMHDSLDKLRAINIGKLEDDADFHKYICKCISLLHRELEICGGTLIPFQTLLKEKVEELLKSLALPDTNIDANHLCEELGWTRGLFDRIAKCCFGMSVSKYIADMRIKQACYLLVHTDMNIKRIAYELGFSGISSFSKMFFQHTGISPSLYRRTKQSEHGKDGLN